MAHAAGPNMTHSPRPRHDLRLHARRAVFNGIQNILTDEQVASLNPGDPLDDESQTPCVVAPQGHGLTALARFGNGSGQPGFPGAFRSALVRGGAAECLPGPV